jgi:hypothetical protein
VLWLLGTVYGQTGELGQIVDGPCARFQAVAVQPFLKKLVSLHYICSYGSNIVEIVDFNS